MLVRWLMSDESLEGGLCFANCCVLSVGRMFAQ